MKQDDLRRLHQLRETRKQKALEALAARQAAARHAELQLANAQAAVSEHAELLLQQEADSLAGMLGKVVSHADIAMHHSELIVQAQRLEVLRARETASGKRQEAAQSDVRSASAVFHQRYRSAEKLRHLIDEQGRKSQRRQLALTEAGDDELRPRRPVQGRVE